METENYGSIYDKILKIKVENSLLVSLEYNCVTMSEELVSIVFFGPLSYLIWKWKCKNIQQQQAQC